MFVLVFLIPFFFPSPVSHCLYSKSYKTQRKLWNPTFPTSETHSWQTQSIVSTRTRKRWLQATLQSLVGPATPISLNHGHSIYCGRVPWSSRFFEVGVATNGFRWFLWDLGSDDVEMYTFLAGTCSTTAALLTAHTRECVLFVFLLSTRRQDPPHCTVHPVPALILHPTGTRYQHYNCRDKKPTKHTYLV